MRLACITVPNFRIALERRRAPEAALRGNFNGVKSSNHSKRMLAVYEHGFFPPPRMRLNNDVRGVVAYLWKKWFDCIPATQSNPISPNQHSALQPALPGFDAPPETGENENA